MAHRICPWWLGYFLISPLRRLAHDPDRIVGPYVRPGMTVVDFGCGMGHFSLPMARMVGATGRVVCVDVQDKMLAGLRRRASRVALVDRLDIRTVPAEDTELGGLKNQADFILAMFVIHEVPDAARVLKGLADALRPGGCMLLAEPGFHVSERAFLDTVAIAERLGLTVVEHPTVRRSRAVLLRSPAP
jgi:2-polyprenyl-3-methyl-5-hydroxy-6-metoxy-1,4-benzoquinol methylase